jgi:hypothetical protein
MPEWNFTHFLLGCVGAIAPEIVRLFTMRNNPDRFKWSWFYLIISLLFAALGGVFAVYLGAPNPAGPIYTGLTTPVFINKALAGASGSKKLKAVEGEASAPKSVSFQSFLSGL